MLIVDLIRMQKKKIETVFRFSPSHCTIYKREKNNLE
jgi:hypothetical protein